MTALFSIERSSFLGNPTVVVTRLATGTDHGRIDTYALDAAIELRDLLLREFPLEGWGSPGEVAALAEHGAHRERRERIATEVMARRASRPYAETVQSTFGDDARFAIKAADALIAALDEERS